VVSAAPLRSGGLLRIEIAGPRKTAPYEPLLVGPARPDPGGSPCISPRERRGCPTVAGSETFDALDHPRRAGAFASAEADYATPVPLPQLLELASVGRLGTEAPRTAQAPLGRQLLWFRPLTIPG